MSNITLNSQSAGREMAADMAQAEAAAIGAAADRKRRRESESSIDAILSSEGANGKAVYWHRTILANGERRESLEVERSGAYTPRAFLRMAEKAAGQAGKGRWNRPEAVESVAAELVARTLGETGGRMPKRGSLARKVSGKHENPDLAYLTVAARHLIADAMRGEDAGLASEAAPIGDDGDSGRPLAELMGEAETAAEGPRDPYISEPVEPGSDLLNPEARKMARELGNLSHGSPAPIETAIAAALRPAAKSADLADAGYASSPAAVRKAAERGRKALRPLLEGIRAQRAEIPTANRVSHYMAAVILDRLDAQESSEPADKSPMETTPHGIYRRPNIDWPMVREPEEISPVISYTASEPDWRVTL